MKSEENKKKSQISISLVNVIFQGDKNYTDERKAKKVEMNISTAYAWVKSNHIVAISAIPLFQYDAQQVKL
jgi:hypothetical protein